jgi:hypothetical protein
VFARPVVVLIRLALTHDRHAVLDVNDVAVVLGVGVAAVRDPNEPGRLEFKLERFPLGALNGLRVCFRDDAVFTADF